MGLLDRFTTTLNKIFTDPQEHSPQPFTQSLFDSAEEAVTAFYSKDKQRDSNGEISYGDGWHDGTQLPYRVAYIPSTGELYIVGLIPPVHTVEVLCVIKHVENPDKRHRYYATVNQVLDGWEEWMPAPNGLAWLRDRAREAQRRHRLRTYNTTYVRNRRKNMTRAERDAYNRKQMSYRAPNTHDVVAKYAKKRKRTREEFNAWLRAKRASRTPEQIARDNQFERERYRRRTPEQNRRYIANSIAKRKKLKQDSEMNNGVTDDSA